MRKLIKKIIYFGLMLLLFLSFIACSNNSASSKGNEARPTSSNKMKTIKIGTMPENEQLVELFREELKSIGYKLEVILFSANQLPATALKDGDIDGVILNQKHWVDKFNEGNNSNLHMVEPYMFYVTGALYSEKYDRLEDLPQNAQIAIPGDPTNMENALLGFEKAGLITLGNKKDEFYSLMDIIDNPKNIEFLETERGTTARAIKDVDALRCGAVEARQAGIDVSKFLFDDFERYPHGLIVQSKQDIDLDWVKKIVEHSKSDEFEQKLFSYYQGTLAPWKD